MNAMQTRRSVLFVLLGVAALMLKAAYRGPQAALVAAYGGNLAASFAVYFLATVAAARLGRGRTFAVASALLAVEAFELTDGFGVMSNTYDPWDLLANAVGVASGLGLDLGIAAGLRGRTRE